MATYASATSADAAVGELRRSGVIPLRTIDPRGNHVVSVGPVPTFVAAQQLKARFVQKFPDAVILP
jgi:hypothetical protein